MPTKTTKYSKQREYILKYLMSTNSHPTADEVYHHIHQEIPNISLGTVYRNLNFLVDQGKIMKLSFGNGPDHFDGFTHAHFHFVCSECNKVFDLNIPNIDSHYFKEILSDFKGEIDEFKLSFYGKCEECMKKIKANKE